MHTQAMHKQKQKEQLRWIRTTLSLLAAAALAFADALGAATAKLPNFVVADSQSTVYIYSPQTGQQYALVQGDARVRPYDVVIDSKGYVIFSDTGLFRIVRVDPRNGQQDVLAQPPELPGVPYGICADKYDRICVANSEVIVRLDPATRHIATIAEGELLKVPLDVVAAPDGKLYVADARAGVICIDPDSKPPTQTLIAHGSPLLNPVGIAIDGNSSLYVADTVAQCIFRISLQDKKPIMVSKPGVLTTPVAIAVVPGGTVLASDPDAFGDLAGGIFAIGPDGTTPILHGSGDLVNPRGIALLPASMSVLGNRATVR